MAPGAEFATPVDDSLTLYRMDYQIPAEFGQAWLETLELNEGLRLYRGVHHLEQATFGQLVPILEVTSSAPEPLFCAQTFLSGISCHEEYGQGRTTAPVEVWGRPALDTFHFRQHWDARVLIAGGGTTEMRSITVPQTLLQVLLGDSLMTQLLERLGLNKATPSITRKIPPHLNAPLQEAMSDRYAGPARRLFAQAKSLEYLGLLVDFMGAEEDNAPQRRHTQKIRELKEVLLNLQGRLPTLNQLANDFGLSAKQLNIEFKAEFGQSIFDWITHHRLEQAHDALLKGSLLIKVISERLGYSHTNHFNAAFKRKFGCLPGSLRKP